MLEDGVDIFTVKRLLGHTVADVLNTGCFHVVFTVPSELRQVFYQNQAVLYNLLFKAAAASKKYLGARSGFTSILHTRGQNLCCYPHIHRIVPGGGLDALGRWRDSPKKFFIPVKVLSRLFRGEFLYQLKQADLQFYGELKYLENPSHWSRLLDACYRSSAASLLSRMPPVW